MTQLNFAKEVERLIDPISVGSLHFIQSFNRLLPKSIQKKLVKSSSKQTPYMGFVVEPYSFFLCYEIADLDMAKSLLPDSFSLVKTSIFADDEPKYYCIFGCIRAHTSAFWGSRTEFYVIAQDDKTELLSWIIIDYNTDTISYDSKHGLSAPNSKSVMTIDYNGTVYVDTARHDGSNNLSLDADITKGKMTDLDQRLWLEGNLSIGYGRNLSENGADIFALKFEPGEVSRALRISKNDVNIQKNTWYPGLLKPEPSQIICFPYAQHFVSDSPGHSSVIKNKQQLETAVKSLDFTKIKVFSTDSFKTMMLVSSFVSLLVTIVLVVILVTK